MSLFKQISLIMSLFLLFVLISVMTFNLQSAKRYAQEELSNNAQNTATYLSLSLANAKGELSRMSTIINAVFDSGYFQSIHLEDTEGVVLYAQLKEKETSEVPQWFKSMYKLKPSLASATVSSGWNPIGLIKVSPIVENAHKKLYENFLEIIQSFVLISILTFVLLFVLLRLILSSLKKVTQQAEAVSSNNFIINEKIPSTTEFKEVTLAMNNMVNKVKSIFEKEAASVQDYHRLLYKDRLTGLGNRSFFELKLNEFLSSQESETKGVILTLFFDGIVDANKAIGQKRVDEIIRELSHEAEKLTIDHKHAVISHIDATKTSIVFPGICLEDIEEISDKLLTQSIIILDRVSLPECAIKVLQLNYTAKDNVDELLHRIEKSLPDLERNTVCNISEQASQSETLNRSVIEERIREHSIALALQDVYDRDENILHAEAYVRLYDEQKNIHEAGDFIPIVHKLHLDTKLDQNVINYALKEPLLQDREIAINISLRFICDHSATQWLKERLAGVDDEKRLNFEISNHNLLSSLNDAFAFSNMVKEAGHYFGIDRFSIEEGTNLNYLQMLNPQYLKIDSAYLYEMLQGEKGQTNHALQILIESLDIKIIASNIEDIKIKEALEKIGIKYFQGSLLAKPKLI